MLLKNIGFTIFVESLQILKNLSSINNIRSFYFMTINSNLDFIEKGRNIIQREIKSLNSVLLKQNEEIWCERVNSILNDSYMTLYERLLDNEAITKEVIADYFFQESDLTNKLQIEMESTFNRPLYEIEDLLIERIIQAMESNLISLWMKQ